MPPPGARVGEVRTPDAVSIRYAMWKSRRAPFRGTVVLAQGRTEYIEKYFETAGELLDEGYDVCAFDWRGQGGSQRLLSDAKRGYVDEFDQYVMDLDTVLDQIVLPDCRAPYSMIAHSTGALVALLAAPLVGNRIQRMMLCSPLIRFGSIPMPQTITKILSGALSVIGLGDVYLAGSREIAANRGFVDNVLTSDTRRFERNHGFAREHPELVIGGPTAAWLFAACRAMDQLDDPDFIGSIHIPTLLVAAGRDQVVSNAAIERFGYAMRSGRTIVIDRARHELLQERDVFRQQLLAAFRAFTPGAEAV